MEDPISQKALHQTNVAVLEKDLLELIQDAFVSNAIESLGDAQKERGRLLAVATGFHHGLHESQQLLSSGVGISKAELFGNQHIPSLKMVSYTTLYETTFEDFRHGGKKADGPEVVRSKASLPGFGITKTVAFVYCRGSK